MIVYPLMTFDRENGMKFLATGMMLGASTSGLGSHAIQKIATIHTSSGFISGNPI
jgi:hypothetical protein